MKAFSPFFLSAFFFSFLATTSLFRNIFASLESFSSTGIFYFKFARSKISKPYKRSPIKRSIPKDFSALEWDHSLRHYSRKIVKLDGVVKCLSQNGIAYFFFKLPRRSIRFYRGYVNVKQIDFISEPISCAVLCCRKKKSVLSFLYTAYSILLSKKSNVFSRCADVVWTRCKFGGVLNP